LNLLYCFAAGDLTVDPLRHVVDYRQRSATYVFHSRSISDRSRDSHKSSRLGPAHPGFAVSLYRLLLIGVHIGFAAS
jgi:hypothetical protein